MSLDGANAANRFGLGARPSDICDDASKNPKAWLKAQLASDDDPHRGFAGLPSSADQVKELAARAQARREAGGQQPGAKADRQAATIPSRAIRKPINRRSGQKLSKNISCKPGRIICAKCRRAS